VFCCLFPIIAPAALISFSFRYWVDKYNLYYVKPREYDSNGTIVNTALYFTVVCLLLFQFAMLTFFYLRGLTAHLVVVSLTVCSFVFYCIYLGKRFVCVCHFSQILTINFFLALRALQMKNKTKPVPIWSSDDEVKTAVHNAYMEVIVYRVQRLETNTKRVFFSQPFLKVGLHFKRAKQASVRSTTEIVNNNENENENEL
jgi:hypothetical protein